MSLKRYGGRILAQARHRVTRAAQRQPLSRRSFAMITASAIAVIGGVLAWQLNQTILLAEGNAAWMQWSQTIQATANSTEWVIRAVRGGDALLLEAGGSVSPSAVSGLAAELRGGWSDLPEPPGASAELISAAQEALRRVQAVVGQLDSVSSQAAGGQADDARKSLEQLRQTPTLTQLHDRLDALRTASGHAWVAYAQAQRALLARAVWIDLTCIEAMIGLLAALGLGLYWPTDTMGRGRPSRVDITSRSRDRVPDRLLDIVGHDLRQPLQALGSFLSALERQAAQPELAVMIEGMRSATSTMDRMIRGLLDMSRLDAGRITVELEEFNLSAVLDPIRREYANLAAEKRIDLKAAQVAGIVYTDPTLIESILRNLVSNAVKYTEAGWVELRAIRNGQRLTIEVEDTGSGIAPDEIGRIFDEFYRSGSAQKTADGLGLGLAVAYRMAALLGLTIRVKSVLGQGSIFSIDIPRSNLASVEPAAGIEAHGAASPPLHALRGLQLLVVDDDPQILKAMTAELEPLGVAVTVAHGPDEARTLLRDRPGVAFAVIDMNLGSGITGAELLDQLATEEGVAVPALIMTGSTEHDVLRELRQGDLPWVQKPVSAAELNKWVMQLRARGDGTAARVAEESVRLAD